MSSSRSVHAGMDVARLNFSHGTHHDHKSVYERVRRAADAAGKAVGILADLQGPKIRLGKFRDDGIRNGEVTWTTGDEVRITVDDVDGTQGRVSTTYMQLAVLDGADAVMLSGETSVGKWPIEAVRTMHRIAHTVEASSREVPPISRVPRTKRGVISYAARDIGERLEAKALVAFIQSGDTAHRLARLHSRLPLLAFTPTQEVRSQLALSRGTETFIVDHVDTTDHLIDQVDHQLPRVGRLQRGDVVVIVAGAPPRTVGSTNMIHVQPNR